MCGSISLFFVLCAPSLSYVFEGEPKLFINLAKIGSLLWLSIYFLRLCVSPEHNPSVLSPHYFTPKPKTSVPFLFHLPYVVLQIKTLLSFN